MARIKRKLRLRLEKERVKKARSRAKNLSYSKRLDKIRALLNSKEDSKVAVILIRSLIAKLPQHIQTAYALGLKKRGQKKIHSLNMPLKGMIRSIIHLVDLEEVN